MNSRYFPAAEHNLIDTSFQINAGLYADQSQLNELEFDLDPFDEANLHNDPFATPLHIPHNNNPLTVQDLTPIAVNPKSFQSPLLPETSANPTDAGEPPSASSSSSSTNEPPKNTSFLQASEQLTPDDFFNVRKRNGNSRIGVDLTSKSTARLWKTKDKKITPEEFEAIVQSKLPFACPPVSPPIESIRVSTTATKPDSPVVENAVILADSGPDLKHPETVTERKPTKIPKSLKSSISSASMRAIGHKKTKSSGIRKQESKEKAKVKEPERRKSNGSLASISGGLIDALMSYGEKIRNSLGLSSNASEPEPEEATESGAMAEALTQNEQSTPPSSSGAETALNPSLSNMNPVDASQRNAEETAMNIDEIPPMPTSKKRLLPFSPGRERKRKRLQNENANVYRSNFATSLDEKTLPTNKRHEKDNILKEHISRPKPLRPSRNINKVSALGGRNKLKSFATKFNSGRTTATSRSVSSSSVSGANSQPLFASDVYRQLAVEKAQKEEFEKTRAQFTKPVPPARPALRPTIPAAFVFRSEERIAQRHADADEKPKAETASKEGHSASNHTATGELNRSKQPSSILSADGPILNTMIRAKAREKFDNERREREKLLELQRLIRERERAEQEEKEYKEARKRTIPRAHEVPEWYKDVPHKQGYVE